MFFLIIAVIWYRDASVKDLRATSDGDIAKIESSNEIAGIESSNDIARIGSSNGVANALVNQDKGTDGNQQSSKDDCGEAPCFQSGVLRTNCIYCLDRTNVAQYAYGLQALGRQLHAMGLSDVSKVNPDSSIAAALMDMYQSMGDALAQQYGGSAAHNTVCIKFYVIQLI